MHQTLPKNIEKITINGHHRDHTNKLARFVFLNSFKNTGSEEPALNPIIIRNIRTHKEISLKNNGKTE